MHYRRFPRSFWIATIFLLTAVGIVNAQSTKPRQETLLNGLKVLMWRDTTANKITLKVRLNIGSAFDLQGKEGWMKLLADNTFPTAESRDFFKEYLGGSLEIITNYDYIQVSATATPDQLLTLLETVSRAVSNPVIDKETTAKLRTMQLERVKRLEK